MALNFCPGCGKELNGKSNFCPYCGCQLIQEIVAEEEKKNPSFCEKCGTQLPEDGENCPQCSCPASEEETVSGEGETPTGEEVPSENASGEIVQAENPVIQNIQPPVMAMPPKKSKGGLIAVIVVAVLLVFAAIITIFAVSASNSKKVEEYGDNLNLVTMTMLSGAAKAEDAGNLIKSVWYDTIYEEYDSETYKYTHSNGYGFNDDFNDSLAALFSDSTFRTQISEIESNQETVEGLMKQLQDPPEEYEAAYDALMDYYSAYLELTGLVVNPSGSLQTFSQNFNSADSETLKCYKAMQIYIEE